MPGDWQRDASDWAASRYREVSGDCRTEAPRDEPRVVPRHRDPPRELERDMMNLSLKPRIVTRVRGRVT